MMKRRGAMLLELAVAAGIVGVLLFACLQLLGAAAAQRRAAEQRQCAQLELGNIMEQIAVRPWDELTSDSLGKEKLSPSAQSQLPGAELKIDVFTSAEDPQAKRITALLRWQDRSNQYIVPLALTTWRYDLSAQPPISKP